MTTTPNRLSRRRFMGAAAAAAAALTAGCEDDHRALPAQDVDASNLPPLPQAGRPPLCNVRCFFTQEEARTVEAVAARLIPGDDDDPGAVQAGAVDYIDQKLGRFEAFAETTYRAGPFAVAATARGPQEEPDGFIYVDESLLPRYGFQSDGTPHDAWRAGLESLDAYSRARFGAPFADLPGGKQDKVLEAVEAGTASSFTSPMAADFFALAQEDVVEGTFADPVYGGNRDLVGWRMIGYPGAQRAYTPREMQHGTRRVPQGLSGLHATNPGHPDPHAAHPVAGTGDERR